MCSLRALLSVCVTFHPSTHHFQPHHQIEWKQFSTNSPFIQWFIQSSHRLRWHSTSSTFHHLHIIMRQYASLLYVSLYHFISLIYPAFHVEWNIILKLQCTSLRQGIHWQKIYSLGTYAFICTRGISMCVCGHVGICVKYRNREKRKERLECRVCARSCMHTSLRLIIMGWVAINVALIREAFMCGGLRRVPGDLWKTAGEIAQRT